jgi:hypothetical protein
MRASAEIAVTATAGSLLIAWGLSEFLGTDSPRISAWAFATTVLSFVGFFTQTFFFKHASPTAEKSAKDNA